MTHPDGSRPKRRLRGYLILTVKVAFTALVCWFIWREIAPDLTGFRWEEIQLHPGYLMFSALLLTGEWLMAGWIWSRLAEGFGDSRIRLLKAASINLMANFGRYIPGKVFHVAGLALLAKRVGMRSRVAIAAAISGQGLNLVAAGLVGAWVLGTGLGIDINPLWPLAGCILALLALWTTINSRVVGNLFTQAVRQGAAAHPAGKTESHSPELYNPNNQKGLTLTRSKLGRWLVAYTVKWGVAGLAFFTLARGLGFELSPLAATTAFAAAYLVGYLVIIAPGGIGVREGTLVLILTPALGEGAAFVLAAAQRLWTVGFEIIFAVPSGIALTRKAGKGDSPT